MTTNLQEHQNFITECLSKDDFESVYNFLLKEKLPVNFLVSLYRQGKKIPNPNNPEKVKALSYFTIRSFWKSQLPFLYLKEVLESDLRISFYQEYFSKSQFCSHLLNKKLIEESEEAFIKFYKLFKAFKHESFWASLIELSKDLPTIHKLQKELAVVIKASEKIDAEEIEDNAEFVNFQLCEVLLVFTLYNYSLKLQAEMIGNSGMQTRMEFAFVSEIDRVLKLFMKSGKISKESYKFPTNDSLQNDYKRHCKDPFSFEVIRIRELIDRSIKREIDRKQIDLYLVGYADFIAAFLNPAFLKSNNRFASYQLNNTKSQPEELYFSKFEIKDKEIIREERESTFKDLAVLNFYGIPTIYKCKGYKVNLEKVLQLLLAFSHFRFHNRDQHLILFEYDQLVKTISEYFKWSEIEVEQILHFLTTELTGNRLPSIWYSQPFLKINDKFLWLGSFLKDRRWDIVLINRLKIDPAFAQLLPMNFETNICKSFQKAGFAAICRTKFKTTNWHGEIDTLAFKDNWLFIIETKSGARSDDFSYAAKIEEVRLEGCAAEQLCKIQNYIKEDWEKVKGLMKIDTLKSIDEVKIFPLIITDYFEGDLALYKDTIHKISFLELDVILSNKKKKLLELYEIAQSMHNNLNPNFKGKTELAREWDLWDGAKKITGNLLVKCIEQNRVWNDLENTWEFKPLEYGIDW